MSVKQNKTIEVSQESTGTLKEKSHTSWSWATEPISTNFLETIDCYNKFSDAELMRSKYWYKHKENIIKQSEAIISKFLTLISLVVTFFSILKIYFNYNLFESFAFIWLLILLIILILLILVTSLSGVAISKILHCIEYVQDERQIQAKTVGNEKKMVTK